MSKSNSPTARLALLAFCLIGLGFLTVILNLMVLWFVLFAVLCGYFLFRYRNQIRRQDCILGVAFASIAMISHPLMGFFVLPGYVASAARMRDIPHPIVLYHPGKKNELWKTMGWILAAGSCLGIFNLWLGSSQLTIVPSFQLNFLFDALRAGLFEEILFRTLLYALCIEVMGKIKPNPAQTALCLLIMILPHVLIHFSGTIEIGSLIVMSVAFGLPFALLQCKVNLSAAIGAHALVDLIRFIVFGA